MYAKLVLRSARRSVGDYLIYLVTLTLCVGLFYAFLSISSRHYHPDIGAEFDLTFLSDGMKVAVCGVTLLLWFLIRYVNRYMLRQKQPTLAIQGVLGMESRTMAWLFFAETFCVSLLALGLGILLGVVLSQFITALLLASYGQPFQLTFSLYPDTVGLTLAFFAVSFLVTGLFHVRSIRRMPLLDMLQATRRNEGDLKRSRWMPVVTVLYLLALVGMGAMGVWLITLYDDPRLPLPGRVLYWANALLPLAGVAGSLVWLVRRKAWGFPRLLGYLMAIAVGCGLFAALTPSFRSAYFLPLSAENLNLYLTFLVGDVVFLICALFYLCARWVAAWKARSPAHKYTGENLFFFGQILSQLRSTSKSMALICLTLLLSLFCFLTTPALAGWAEGYLASRSMYDVQVSSDYNQVYDPADLPLEEYDLVTQFLEARGIAVEADCTFPLYLPREAQFHQRYKYDFPPVAMALSDYNAIRAMAGYEPIALAPGTFATQWRATAGEEDRSAFLAAHPTLTTDGGTLTLAAGTPAYTDALGETLYNDYTDLVYILPDEVCQALMPVMTNRYLTTTEPIPYADARDLSTTFRQTYSEDSVEGQPRYTIRTSTEQVNESTASTFLLRTLMTYGAVVLMVTCFTILSLQQLWDARQHRYRFGVLRKLGVEERDLHRLITRQLAFWFGLPVGVAACFALVVVPFFFATISTEITAYLGFSVLLPQVGAIAAILLLLLAAYYAATYTLFRRAVG